MALKLALGCSDSSYGALAKRMCCTSPCTACAEFESLSISGTSVITAVSPWCTDFPGIDGTYAAATFSSFSGDCWLYKSFLSEFCVAFGYGHLNQQLIVSVQFHRMFAGEITGTTEGAGPVPFPFSSGFRVVVWVSYTVYKTAELFFPEVMREGHRYYKDFDACPSGTVALTFLDTDDGLYNTSYSTAPSVSMTWP